MPVSGRDVKVHFLPYATADKKWEIAHDTKLTKGEKEFTLSKTITSKDGGSVHRWPGTGWGDGGHNDHDSDGD